MAAALTPTLINKDFRNWLKGAMAIHYAKEGLIDLVGHENIDLQRHLLQTVYTQKGIPPGTTCSSCTTANVLPCPTAGFCSKGKRCKAHDSKVPDKKPNQTCPNALCSHIRDAIKNEHRFKGPSWKNTDARRWCSDAFELCKCFMPPDGYSDKTRLADTDFNGILAVVINNNRFQSKMSVNLGLEPNICTEARVVGREIRHSANHLLSDQDLMKYIDDLTTLLSDPAYLAADVTANDAVGKLKQLKTNTLTIHADDITNVLNESIKTTFDDQQKLVLHDIQEHFKKHKNDSVEVIDRKIQDYVDKQLAELKAQTDRGKKELNAEIEKGQNELKLQSKTGKDKVQALLEQGKGVLNSKVEKGKVELSYQTKQGKDKLNSKVEKGKLDLSAKTEQGLDKLHAQVRQGADELKVQTSDGKEELSSHITMGKIEVEAKINQGKEQIAARGKQVLEEINRSAVLKTGNNDDSLLQGAVTKKTQYGFWDKITFKEFRLRLEFKHELVRFYNEKESMIPASPLVEDYAVPLTELYVQPPMSVFNKPNAFGQGNKHSEKTPVRSYRELFLNNDNVPYKNIYLEANAGYGKTSFTQKLAMTWCQAHRPNKLTKRNFKQDDVYTIKRFKFLFLLHLRDFQCDTCNLDELILQFVSRNLPNNEQYSEQFIAKILKNKTCLVIIDGLDEWVHPETCKRAPAVPHNNYRGNCTVLTTTRPWKLSTIGLPPYLIDRHIEISPLNKTTSNELKSNAVKLLSKPSDTNPPDLTDFDRKVFSVKLGDIRLIPYILLQLICIWFDGLSIGKSKCETYSNTIELTLQRGLNKKNAPTLPIGNAERNATVPECIKHNLLCNQYMNLLLEVGKLAFYALFQKIKESSLVIDSTTVLKFLTEHELEFCLKIGLLSQGKDRSKVSVKRYLVYFQHKSVQEFMAALYIVSEWKDETIKSTILEVCSSLSSILEMENLFVFVCGIDREVYTCISGELQTIVDLDSSVCQFRTDMYTDRYDDAWKSMKSYQSMQLECLQESLRNGNDSCPIPLYFVLDKHSLTYDVKTLKSIMQVNESIGKSPQVSLNEKIVAAMLSDEPPFVFMQSLDPGVFTSLETLRVEECYKEPVWLANILTESARTLKCLTLSPGYGISLSDISITALTGLTCLQSLYLAHVRMTHSNLKCLYAYISQTTTLTQLKLEWIRCLDHEGQYRDCDVTLDLHRLNELKMLHLYDVPCRELHVNPACLEKLEFHARLGEKMTARASATLWQDLRAAPVLSSLTLFRMTSCQEMIQTIPTLTQLQHLKLGFIDMDDVIPRVSPEMTHLEHVELSIVTMSSAAWQSLFLSIDQLPRSITVKLSAIRLTSQEWRELLLSVGGLQHPVTVELYWCQGPYEEEWWVIVNVIKTTPTFSLLPDLSIDGRRASLTLKNKTV